ncbi:MAG: hypothetical protein ACI93R_003729 [Flavobacteriales bacterium]|jgi:hypothetical protein
MKENETMQEKVARAAKTVKANPEFYEGLGEAIEKEFGPQGPYFGPRNDIENRKLINEIRETEDDDENT